MKNLILFAIAIATVSLARAQKVSDKKVPTVVKTGFQEQYPTAKKIRWEKENGNYEASFKERKTDYSILLTPKGNIVETEVAIAFVALPAQAKDYLQKHYGDITVKEVTQITDNKGVATYEAEIKGKDLIFDQSGKLLSIGED